ncbi:protein OXIDATIVE STRESS 3-like [Primulina huaijiensis]|uniref:protein OXIDATIVE STRESS 3-like n=1 Tax=Primulina huaijiensis TaxID=1492673 RepID=UPI003CC74E4E
MAQEMKNFQEMGSKKADEYCGSMESSFSSMNDSVDSSSTSSSELADDASSPSSSSDSTSPQLGPLFELAELMSQLPIKRGLSKYYHGKSQTFGSLASVKNLEDLAKKESSYMERMKSCKSYGGNLNHHKFGPKATITKKCPRTSLSPSMATKIGINVVINCKN